MPKPPSSGTQGQGSIHSQGPEQEEASHGQRLGTAVLGPEPRARPHGDRPSHCSYEQARLGKGRASGSSP